MRIPGGRGKNSRVSMVLMDDYSKVILRRGGTGVLVAVFKEKDSLEESPDEL